MFVFIKNRFFLLACAVTLFAVVFCLHFLHAGKKVTSTKNVSLPAVRLQSVEWHRMPLIIHAVGLVKEPQSFIVQTQQPGVIQKINFHAGQHVKKGMVLVVQEHQLQQAALDQASADYAAKLKNYHRQLRLQKKLQGVVVPADLTTQKAALTAAKAAMLEKQVELQQTSIKAPSDGIIEPVVDSSGDANAVTGWVPGSYLPAATSLAKLINNASVRIDYQVNADLRSKLQLGQRVSLVGVDSHEVISTGQLSYISSDVDASNQTVAVSADFPRDSHLVAGLKLQVEQVVDSSRQVMAVPKLSLAADLGGYAVYQIQHGKAVLTPVKLGRRFGSWVEIKQGIALHDQIVVSGMQAIRPGSEVKVVPA
jgi:RND family efflux transporter MFP subunit